ncbi:hypothetical protein AVEN_124960-1 [Araneus ventricosus]|uniref:Uncharacterized protein n=1 Tax=Araneus ventricosus TaxID=182803 RepID=A0A4Y2KAA1_ARAVE|nr:hypothetical protein AVEN_124960-1 [Araneus ventricosus]
MWYRPMGHPSVSYRLDTPPDGTSKCGPPVGHAARWDIQVWAAGGTRRPMGHPSVSHLWGTPPDGISRSEPSMAHVAR